MLDRSDKTRVLTFQCPHCAEWFTCAFGGGKSLRAKRGHENTCVKCGERMRWDGRAWQRVPAAERALP